MGETVGGWAELSLRGLAAAREAVARLGEVAGRRVVAAHAEAYRADHPETIAVDEAAEAVGGARPIWQAEEGVGYIAKRGDSCIPDEQLWRGTTTRVRRRSVRPRCDSRGGARRRRCLSPR